MSPDGTASIKQEPDTDNVQVPQESGAAQEAPLNEVAAPNEPAVQEPRAPSPVRAPAQEPQAPPPAPFRPVIRIKQEPIDDDDDIQFVWSGSAVEAKRAALEKHAKELTTESELKKMELANVRQEIENIKTAKELADETAKLHKLLNGEPAPASETATSSSTPRRRRTRRDEEQELQSAPKRQRAQPTPPSETPKRGRGRPRKTPQ